MKPYVCLSIVLLSTNAHGGVSGQCTYEDTALVFVDAYAGLAPDPFEEKQKVPTLWFTTKPMEHHALASAKPDEIDGAIMDQVFENDSAKLELRLDTEGKLIEGLQLYVPPGTNRSLSSNEVGKLQLKLPMVNRASGRFILDDDDKVKCDLQFDIPMAGKGPPPPAPKPWGVALPAGGGEPGKVYLAMHRATLAGDVEAMLKLAMKEKADQMRAARNDPEFPKMLEMVKAFEPAQVRVVSGRADANRAELQIDGKESDGAAMTGTVKLVKEDGAWRIENVSTKSKLSL